MHIANVVKLSGTDLVVDSHWLAILRKLSAAKILLLLDFEGALPVFAIHCHQEVLEIVKGVHIVWHVLLR